jgi:hypothetical protein
MESVGAFQAKAHLNLEVATEVCMQEIDASNSRKRLEDKLREAFRFSAGF